MCGPKASDLSFLSKLAGPADARLSAYRDQNASQRCGPEPGVGNLEQEVGLGGIEAESQTCSTQVNDQGRKRPLEKRR